MAPSNNTNNSNWKRNLFENNNNCQHNQKLWSLSTRYCKALDIQVPILQHELKEKADEETKLSIIEQ
jgi:hypothetical protein